MTTLRNDSRDWLTGDRGETALPRPDVSAETCLELIQSRTARRADALASVSEGFLAAEAPSLTGGGRQQFIMQLDAHTLGHDHAGRCEQEDSSGRAAETVRRRALLQRANRAKMFLRKRLRAAKSPAR